MKAAVYYENGDPDVFKYEDVADPRCHPKGVVIKVEAVSIEGGDTLNRLRGALSSRPHIVGYQAAGEIVETGSEVTDLKVGQKVTTVAGDGSHAALRAVPARNAWSLPEGMDVRIAAAIPVPFGTAHDCLFEFGRLKAGETVLVQAGASGVGVAAIQLAKRAGARVFATASGDDRLERLKALGMDEGINYSDEDLVQRVMQLTDNEGVDPGRGFRRRLDPAEKHSRAWLSRTRLDGGRGRARTDAGGCVHDDGRQPLALGSIPGRGDRHRPRP